MIDSPANAAGSLSAPDCVAPGEAQLRERTPGPAPMATGWLQPRTGPGIEVMEFALGQERYAIEAGYVREALPCDELTPLPCAPAFLRGLAKVHGRILPMLDLQRLLGLPGAGLASLRGIIVIHAGDLEFGLLVETVRGIRHLAPGAIPPAPETGAAVAWRGGLTHDGVTLLDGARLVADPRLIVHEEIDPDP